MHPNVVIDPTFAALLVPPTAVELAILSRSILDDQECREPLATWRGILLDGHARHRICLEHGIPFEVAEIDLPDREAAICWILERQLGRRNLRPIAMNYYRGRLYLSLKRPVGRPQAGEKSGHDVPICTDEQVAARYRVDPRTIRRDARFAADLNRLADDMGDGFRSSVLSGEAKLTRKDIFSLARMGRRERNRFVRERGRVKPQPPLTPLPKPGNMVLKRLADLWRLAEAETRRTFLSMPDVAAAFEDVPC